MRLAAVAAAALVLAPAAFAHAEVRPATIAVNRPARLTLTVPTESATAATVAVRVTAPAELGLRAGASWSGRTRGDVRLQLAVRPVRVGEYALRVRQTYADGRVVRWSPSVRVQSAQSQNRDRTIVLLATAVVVVAWFALRRRRDQRPQ